MYTDVFLTFIVQNYSFQTKTTIKTLISQLSLPSFILKVKLFCFAFLFKYSLSTLLDPRAIGLCEGRWGWYDINDVYLFYPYSPYIMFYSIPLYHYTLLKSKLKTHNNIGNNRMLVNT